MPNPGELLDVGRQLGEAKCLPDNLHSPSIEISAMGPDELVDKGVHFFVRLRPIEVHFLVGDITV
jgi:hypothetical protein